MGDPTVLTQTSQPRPDQIAVIANPHAGRGEVARSWAGLQKRVRDRLGQEVEFQLTEAPGQARDIARSLVAAGRHALLSVGGDGTHSEVAGGIIEATEGTPTRGALACIHTGTGGDFRRVLGYRREADVLHAVATRVPQPIDAGVVEYVTYEGQHASRHFINIASTGVAGLVDRYVGEAKQRGGFFGGSLAYVSATLRALGSYSPARGEIIIDGQSHGEHDVQNLAVCNGRFFGGGMMIAPEALLDDGLFDIVLVSPAPLFRSLMLAPGLYTGEHANSELITINRGKEVRFTPTSDAVAHMDIDGEPLGRAPATFRLLPKALDVWRHGSADP